ncbi:MAG TPA: flagellar motor protein MotB [Devosiaceae bacterium]
MARKEPAASQVPEWLVTFADLMSLLVCFFVLIISFSIQDKEKLQIVAGSMKDAFGIIEVQKKAGVIEHDGNPERDYLKDVSPVPVKKDTEYSAVDHPEFSRQGQEANTFRTQRTEIDQPGQFSLAAASIRQAWQDLPDITYLQDNLILQETPEGLNIVFADQTGRPMFPEGSKFPYESTRKAIAAIAPILARMPNQIRISGHTAAGGHYDNAQYGKWELTSDRANAVRAILEEFGMPADRMDSVVGKADTAPFFPNDPYMAANQRVTILLLDKKPPVPTSLTP